MAEIDNYTTVEMKNLFVFEIKRDKEKENRGE